MTPSALCPACEWTSEDAPATASSGPCPRCGAALLDPRLERLRLLSVIKAHHRLPPAPRREATPAREPSEIERLILADRPIEAMKRHRQLTGASLKQAKDHVEAVAAKLRGEHAPIAPDTREESAHGNVLVWLFAAFVLSAIAAMWLWNR
ncbi:hypothetical protein [Melittangium boletus]|uniref:Ribosomal protein L7/L12 C-terminal domain-containing protein n=1 Tax=Melittangium boletus DSM 14713 TaxID=1294270 RepID=A0A250IA26_9BACT|nr:hypothetical protein [Melittangium boletus]ATB28073.1 hypothetical protein MEBOL_001518 [Melittangium boletus DSM 14713]